MGLDEKQDRKALRLWRVGGFVCLLRLERLWGQSSRIERRTQRLRLDRMRPPGDESIGYGKRLQSKEEMSVPKACK